jgi:hypothetical protein
MSEVVESNECIRCRGPVWDIDGNGGELHQVRNICKKVVGFKTHCRGTLRTVEPPRCNNTHLKHGQCELHRGHRWRHKAGDRLWEREPSRCGHRDSEQGQCELARGHSGKHLWEEHGPVTFKAKPFIPVDTSVGLLADTLQAEASRIRANAGGYESQDAKAKADACHGDGPGTFKPESIQVLADAANEGALTTAERMASFSGLWPVEPDPTCIAGHGPHCLCRNCQVRSGKAEADRLTNKLSPPEPGSIRHAKHLESKVADLEKRLEAISSDPEVSRLTHCVRKLETRVADLEKRLALIENRD